MKCFLFFLSLTLGVCLLPAQVVHQSENAFGLRIDIDLPQHSPEEVFDAIVKDVSKWWDANHTYTGNSANLSIHKKNGAGLFEKLPGEGWVCHMKILYLQRPAMIRFEGGLGPLQSMPVNGIMDWKIAGAEGGGSKLSLTYEVAGANGGLKALAEPVHGVLKGQLTSLKSFLEK